MTKLNIWLWASLKHKLLIYLNKFEQFTVLINKPKTCTKRRIKVLLETQPLVYFSVLTINFEQASEAELGSWQTSTIKCFAKMVNGFLQFTYMLDRILHTPLGFEDCSSLCLPETALILCGNKSPSNIKL